ncbi:MAG: GAF domain-containing protein [Chloroflexota bacterium]
MTERLPSGEAEAALSTLVAIARRLDTARSLDRGTDDPLLDAISRTAFTVMDAQAASIAVHDPASDELVFVAAAGPSAGDVVGLRIDASAGIAGYAFSTGQPLAVADVASDPRFDRSVAQATGYVPRSLLATPLVDDQGVVGVLEILDRRDGTFTLRDLDVAATLAREATIVVRRGRLERDAVGLLRRALSALVVAPDGLDDAALDALVSAVALRLADDTDDPTWRLADGLARLVATDPDRIELAIDWLDALLRRTPTGRR